MYVTAPSERHGTGLFADRRIEQHETVGRLDFVAADPNDLDHPHVLWITDALAVRVICDLRFINHSEHPNVAYCDDGTVVALRDIDPGEELLHDYEGDAFDDELTEETLESATPSEDFDPEKSDSGDEADLEDSNASPRPGTEAKPIETPAAAPSRDKIEA